MFDLKGKNAMVTGSSRGLGRGMAEALLEAGARAVLVDKSEEVDQTREELKAQGLEAYSVRADLSNHQGRVEAFQKTLEATGGKVDILVNAAGIHDRRACLDLPLEAWNTVIEINLTAVFDLCKMAGEIMVGQKQGKIINIGSMLSFIGGFNASAYAVSKGGVAQLTKSLSNEWAQHGIQVNAIAPGYMATNMNTDLLQDEVRYPQITARIPAGKWGTPKDLAGITVFLASEASNYVTGTIIPVDGGYIVR
jgi:2-deoxy-D-gluconate 3-dehydrogenase